MPDIPLDRLIAACNLDPEIFAWDEASVLDVVRRKVAEGDRRIEAAQLAVARYREASEFEQGARMEAEAERDALVDFEVKPWRGGGHVVRLPILAEGSYPGGTWFAPDWYHFDRREDAVAALWKAAGAEVARA